MERSYAMDDSYEAILALCSIYYLEEELIRKLLTEFNSICNLLVLQMNTAEDIGRTDLKQYRLAKPEYYLELLSKLEYRDIQLTHSKYYSRPLVIARTKRRVD
jgi:predicted Rossmann fold nucleotide-binding protein DprA/Smf involved in DNA uptake